MCTNKLYAIRYKKEYDLRYINEGKRSKPRVLGSVKNFKTLPEVSDKEELIVISCGQCLPCRIHKAKVKALQATCESLLTEKTAFITLTFGDEQCYNYFRKKGYSRYKARQMRDILTWTLEKRQIQLFMKRFRKAVSKQYPECANKIRFFHVGEYGERGGRPHHHLIIFGFDFPDTKNNCISYDPVSKTTLYRSPFLESLWELGFSSVGRVNYTSCAYVSRYCTKKINGMKAQEHYNGRLPEYQTCSNRPGIGKNFFDKFLANDIINCIDDESQLSYAKTKTNITIPNKFNGKKVSTSFPAYFDKLMKDNNTDLYDTVKSYRLSSAMDYWFNNFVELCKDSFDNSQNVIANAYIKSHSRKLECDVDDTPELLRKARAFGVSDSVYNASISDVQSYIDCRSWRDLDFQSKSKHRQAVYNKLMYKVKKYEENYKYSDKITDLRMAQMYYNMAKSLPRVKDELPRDFADSDNLESPLI